ncbi:MAG: ABC transporter substrate-binding protein [Mobilicoccus sp.]|nr:ABC transporter substrate-binding protein [Mobilicoccus sp.]
MGNRAVGTAVLILALAGCAPPDAPVAPPTVHTPDPNTPLVVNTLPLPERFDPVGSDDPYTQRIAGLLQRGLFRYDAKGRALPEVAERVTTEDGRRYRVQLAPGWRFSDGEPVTAHSFVDAWNRAADPASPQVRRELFSPIEGFVPSDAIRAGHDSQPLTGLHVVDDLEFTITLRAPHPGFEQRLGHVAFAPLPRLAFEDPDAYAQRPIGNGPYRVEGEWRADGVTLRPSAAYTAGDAAQNPGLDFRAYPTPQAALADVTAGTLDVLDTLPTDALTDFRTTFGERAISQPVGQVFDLAVPEAGQFTGAAGTQRREALSRAVDREALATGVYAGTRAPATDYAAPVVEGHSQGLCGDTCRLDAGAARDLLEDAGGWSGEMSIAYALDTDDRRAARQICSDVMTNLGVTCTTREHPTTLALLEAVASGEETSPFLHSYRMDYPLLESFLLPRFRSGAMQNVVGYRDPVSDAALARASATEPTAGRTNRFLAAERLVLEDLPVIPLLTVNAAVVSSEAASNVRVDVFGAPVYGQIRRP